MGELVFRCPYSNKLIASGMEVHVPSLQAMADYPISVMCPHCGFQHHGTVADGCVAEAMPPDSDVTLQPATGESIPTRHEPAD
jgi:hypothetical protein